VTSTSSTDRQRAQPVSGHRGRGWARCCGRRWGAVVDHSSLCRRIAIGVRGAGGCRGAAFRAHPDRPRNQLAAGLTQLVTGVGVPAATKLAIRGPSGAAMQDTTRLSVMPARSRPLGRRPSRGRCSLWSPAVEDAGRRWGHGEYRSRPSSRDGTQSDKLIGSLTPDPSPTATGQTIIDGISGRPVRSVVSKLNRNSFSTPWTTRSLPIRRSRPTTPWRRSPS